MSLRNHTFEIGEYYHVYNRGVDKRSIIEDKDDLQRFLMSLSFFNTVNPIGSIYEQSYTKPELGGKATKLVNIIAYCINPNHYHLLITPLTDQGVEKFMQRLGGYSRYFNEKYDRSGNLFQGKFKSRHVADERYLHHLSAYINMNNRSVGGKATKLSASSLFEYTGALPGIEGTFNRLCNTRIVMAGFKNGKEYLKFAKESWADTLERKSALELDD